MTDPPRDGTHPARPRELTVRAYAAREQVTPRTVWNWRAKGAIEIRRTPGGRLRVLLPATDPD